MKYLVAWLSIWSIGCAAIESSGSNDLGAAIDATAPVVDLTSSPDLLGPRSPGVPVTFVVFIQPDGTFVPSALSILSGDTVEWRYSDAHDAVVPTNATSGSGCDAIASVGAASTLDPTGPWPVAMAGVFAMQSLDKGQVGAEAVWQSPHNDGYFLRLLWNQVEPSQDIYDFSVLDREVDQAIAHGKLYSLGIKAGADGTPDWIFTTGGVTRLELQDRGSDGGDDEGTGCGQKMWLGDPTETAYQTRYFDMLRAVGAHLRERADRFRALAYVKISGANLVSHENRLPKRCTSGCICNPKVWAQNGYRPTKLLAFYGAQEAVIAEAFPGKTMSYALIQDGFPSVNEDGDYETETGASSGGPLPSGVDQTVAILKAGRQTWGERFAVQHNGLGQNPGNCPNEGKHPATGPYATVGSGCPNRWVLAEGVDGQVTGFQTNNLQKVMTTADLESTLQNLFDNSDGQFIEIYEPIAMLADAAPSGVLDATASGRTLGEWSDLMHQRRAAFWPQLPPSQTMSHRATLTLPTGVTTTTVRFVQPTKCAQIGSITIAAP